MQILNRKKINIKDEVMYEFKIYANRGEDFRTLQYFYDGDKKFRVFTSEVVERKNLIPIYKVIARYKPQNTIKNYDSLDFLFRVRRIERTDQETIEIIKQNGKTIITLDSPEQCLQEFLMLKQIQKEAMSSDEFSELR